MISREIREKDQNWDLTLKSSAKKSRGGETGTFSGFCNCKTMTPLQVQMMDEEEKGNGGGSSIRKKFCYEIGS